MRASDIDDNNRFDDKRQRVQLKPNRRDAFVAQEQDDGSSSIGDPMTDTEDEQPEVFAGEKSEESENSIEEELAEIYEIQKKAKKEFKKSFRTYKDSKKKVKEIKKSRMGPSSYFPVVAMPPDQSGVNQPSGSQQVTPKPFRPDRRDQPRGRGTGKFMKSGPKKEEAHLAQSGLITEFNYVVMEDQSFDDEVFLASVPVGHAILDTGCTTSVVGQVTADTLSEFMEQCGHPKPVPVALPPVELKGFNGVTEVTTQGLRWTCKLGSLYGHITTYVIPGQTPFLLSRRVLESMGAVIDLSNHSVTSVKHGMNGVPLRQASNGHLLLPICELPEELQLNACEDENEPNTSELSVKGMASSSTLPEATAEVPEDSSCLETKGSKAVKITLCDRRKAFQTIVKNTKNAIIDLETHRDSLTKIFGERGKQIIYGAVAYSPKKERVPADSNRVAYEGSIATLGTDGDFCVHPWRMRPPSEDRRQVAPMKVAIFVYIAPFPSDPEDPSHMPETCEDQCFCCRSPNTDNSDEIGFQDNDLSVEALYEDTDWIDASRQNPVPEVTQVRLRKNIQSIRSVTSRLVLSRIQSDRRGVRKQLKEWLGVQAPKLDKPVGLIEVFAGKGNLSRVHEEVNQDGSEKLGLDHGQDFTKVLREEAAKAFLEEHSKDIWRRAIASRSRPIRGPYVAGQLVYMFRRQGKGMLQTRRGVWIGPGRIIGTESESSGPVPRLVWVSFNGFLYRCSPEGLRPLPEDEMLFKKLSRELSEGRVSSDIERAEDQLSSKRGQFGQFVDLLPDVPEEADFELSEDVQGGPNAPDPHTEGGPRKVRRRFYRSDDYTGRQNQPVCPQEVRYMRALHPKW